jgi:hypothetical protein
VLLDAPSDFAVEAAGLSPFSDLSDFSDFSDFSAFSEDVVLVDFSALRAFLRASEG